MAELRKVRGCLFILCCVLVSCAFHPVNVFSDEEKLEKVEFLAILGKVPALDAGFLVASKKGFYAEEDLEVSFFRRHRGGA